MNLYFEYYIKVDNKHNKDLKKLLNWISYDVNFDNKKYLLRKDYIEYWLDTSIREDTSFWALWDMSILQTFSYITSRFNELLDKEDSFATCIKQLFTDKSYNYESFYSIIRLIRSISIHWSLSKDYKLEEGDFSKRKAKQIKEWIDKLDLNLNIVDKLHYLSISIDLSKIQVWYKFSEIFDWYKMLMFIELCMNIINYYNEKNNI